MSQSAPFAVLSVSQSVLRRASVGQLACLIRWCTSGTFIQPEGVEFDWEDLCVRMLFGNYLVLVPGGSVD